MKILQEQQVDLVFLDIQMPGLTGLQFIQSIPQKPMFILITAYEKYALEGYNLNVVDYLVKPVALDRFIKACGKASELYELKHASREAGKTAEPQYFFVNADYSMVKVDFGDIVWVEGLKDYVKIHLKSTSRPMITRMSMKAIEEQLPPAGFIRIHKSYIVSKDQITAIRKNSVFIGTSELPISESYKDAINALVGKGNEEGT